MNNKNFNPTCYIVDFWDEDNTIQIKEEIYPMHQYSFSDVTELLKGKEYTCDIYEGRYCKKREKYITFGKSYFWNGYEWILQILITSDFCLKHGGMYYEDCGKGNRIINKNGSC